MPHHTLTSRLLVLLVLSFSTRGQAFGKQISMPQSLLELQHSPSPYECAVLSAHVYSDDLQEGDPVVWIDPNTQQVHALRSCAMLESNSQPPCVMLRLALSLVLSVAKEQPRSGEASLCIGCLYRFLAAPSLCSG